MDQNMILAAILGFGVALALMYLVLRKYTYPAVEEPFFSDPAFFKLFTVGLIAGTGIFIAYTFFNGAWGSIFVALMFALVSELAKLIVLNLRRFHGKSDSLFYGFGLGIGVGCTFSFGFIFYASSSVDELGMGDASLWIFFALYALHTVLIHTATGLTIGEGIAKRRPFEFLLQALIISVAYQLLISQLWSGYDGALLYAFIILPLLLAAGYFYHTVYVRLPNVIREVLRQEGKSRKDIPR